MTTVLDYGRAAPTRWRRLVRWTIVALLLVALALAGLFAFRSLATWLARREGYAKVTAWYQQARTCVVPAGTLLYSEVAADDVPGGAGALSANMLPTGIIFTTVSFPRASPLLATVAHDANGVPMLIGAGDVLYVHEHPKWAETGPPRLNLFCVSYRGLDASGQPQFFSTAYELVDPTGRICFPFMGSITTVRTPLTRSLAKLRIFAGAPNATDPTRFSLPFTCDGGAGRFEFQTDVDVTDGGQLAPSVTIAWDDVPTSQPATRPGVADAISP